MTLILQIVDAHGQVALSITRPAKVVKSRLLISNGTGAEIGQIVQENAIGKSRFAMVVGGQRIGVLICWDQWYPEGARITKTW